MRTLANANDVLSFRTSALQGWSPAVCSACFPDTLRGGSFRFDVNFVSPVLGNNWPQCYLKESAYDTIFNVGSPLFPSLF